MSCIAQVTSDEQIARMAITQHIVVTVPASTPIYVVLEHTPKATAALPTARSPLPSTANLDELRQLLQLQRELNVSNGNHP
jgi:hypothetical protein